MILLAYGPNYFARDKKIRELIDAKRIQYPDVFYAVYQGDDPEVNGRVWSGVAETGLFSSGKRIIVVHNALVCAKQNEELWKQSMTRATHDDVLCILLEKGTKENKKWEKEITAGAEYKAQFFKPYTQKDACIVLRTLAEECKTTIDVNTAMYIYQTAGEDMYGAQEEIRRLALLQKPIDMKLMHSLPEYTEERAVYEFARAVCDHAPLQKRLLLWEYMCLQKADPYMLFGYMAKMARKKSLIHALARADEMVKTGKLEMEQALEKIVIGEA